MSKFWTMFLSSGHLYDDDDDEKQQFILNNLANKA